MGILGFIARKKQEFRDASVERRKLQIENENALLEREKKRQQDLRSLEKNRAVLYNEVQDLTQQNAAYRGPTALEKFGRGAAAALERGKKIQSQAGQENKARAAAGVARLVNEGRDQQLAAIKPAGIFDFKPTGSPFAQKKEKK